MVVLPTRQQNVNSKGHLTKGTARGLNLTNERLPGDRFGPEDTARAIPNSSSTAAAMQTRAVSRKEYFERKLRERRGGEESMTLSVPCDRQRGACVAGISARQSGWRFCEEVKHLMKKKKISLDLAPFV